ncbi:copper homeostasis protein CutC [Ravibacter arvi]|uniref:PF03932 family protein CutC n=1 Tax=Ravibacter arvi TaxID=2051041 RepID=A0ABP8LYZ1_9BACT
MLVEVCAYSLESCQNAENAGAGRIELCAGLGEGGTTPSTGLLLQVRQHVKIPVYAMIRPRGGDFVYDEREIETMFTDIEQVRKAGADGIVVGALLPDGTVDVALTKSLVQAAGPLGVTFHRAFDLTPDPKAAVEAIIAAGAERILTSGQHANVDLGLETLRRVVAYAAGRIEIMAGGGVKQSNVEQLIAAGVNCIHLTGKAFRKGRQVFFPESVSMAGEQPDERSVMYSDLSVLTEVVKRAGGR